MRKFGRAVDIVFRLPVVCLVALVMLPVNVLDFLWVRLVDSSDSV